ncbi:MAG: GNAT family N-acetyltransferase [Bacteroidota bacterium]
MKIHSYGIVLESLNEDDLELVRIWRNSDFVRPYMHFQKIIEPEAQNEWFKNIDQKSNFYFIISYKGRKLGLIHVKGIDWQNASGEAGIFIGRAEFANTLVPVLATLTLIDFAFQTLKLQKLKAKIMRNNLKVIQFNLALGYHLSESNSEQAYAYYDLMASDYALASKEMKSSLKKMDTQFKLEIEESVRELINSVIQK